MITHENTDAEIAAAFWRSDHAAPVLEGMRLARALPAFLTGKSARFHTSGASSPIFAFESDAHSDAFFAPCDRTRRASCHHRAHQWAHRFHDIFAATLDSWPK